MIFRIYFKEIALIFLYALSGSSIFHFPHMWWMAFIALVPLCFCLELCSSRREALIFGYAAGMLVTAFNYYWVLHVTVTGFLALCVYLGFFHALFAFFAFENIQVLGRSGTRRFGWGWLKVWVLAALWVLVEYLRSHVPVMRFPWALLAYSQWKNTVFIQAADTVGSYGLSFVIAAASFGAFFLLRAARNLWRGDLSLFTFIVQTLLVAVLAAAPAAGCFYYGQKVLEQDAKEVLRRQTSPRCRISLIQGNIPQEEKWDHRIQGMVFNKYLGLSRQTVMDEPDIVIWPETSFPGYWEYEEDMTRRVGELAKEVGSEFLIGSPTFMETERGVLRMNSAVFISRFGKEIARHHKLRLVPFGEYVPFFKFLRHFFDDIGRFSHGRVMTLFEIPRFRVGDVLQTASSAARPSGLHRRGHRPAMAVLICFEDIFPDLCRQFVRAGADLLVNITNDAWFKDSTGPYQHAQASVLRAVENRVPVVRAANTGLSCFIDPAGRITDSVREGEREILVSGFKTADVVMYGDDPLYTRYGDVCIPVFLLIWILLHRPLIHRLEKHHDRWEGE